MSLPVQNFQLSEVAETGMDLRDCARRLAGGFEPLTA